MLKYNITGRKHSAVFLDPNTGGGSGGSGGTSGQTENSGGETATLDPKLFDQIPMDDLDDETKKVINQIKAGAIATSQQNQTLKSQHENAETRARSFQAETDRVKAELAKHTSSNQQQQSDDPILKAIEVNLQKQGYKPDEIKALAPTFAGMFKDVAALQRETLGKDLQPLVGTVLATQATNAFQEAQANDPLEMLKIPEVATATWNVIKDRAKAGKESDAEIVLNFAKMFWADHQLKAKTNGGSGTKSGILPDTPPGMNTGGFPFVGGGAGIHSIAPRPADPNAARTTMNEDTREAVATSLKSMTRGLKIKLPAEFENVGGRRK